MTIGGILALVLLIFSAFYFTRGGSKLNVDLDRITISEIKKDKFQESIPQNGTVMPLHTIYLNTVDGGRVSEIYVQDGDILKDGQPILRLTNTQVELDAASQANAVSTTLSQMQLARVQADENTVGKLNSKADVELLYREAERTYNLDTKLYAQHVIGSQEYQTAVNNYNAYKQKLALQVEILHQDTVSRIAQDKQDQESYQRAQQTLNIMQQKVNNLTIRAPIDGQITALDAEIGQTKTAGYPLAQIDQLNGFKVRLDGCGSTLSSTASLTARPAPSNSTIRPTR